MIREMMAYSLDQKAKAQSKKLGTGSEDCFFKYLELDEVKTSSVVSADYLLRCPNCNSDQTHVHKIGTREGCSDPGFLDTFIVFECQAYPCGFQFEVNFFSSEDQTRIRANAYEEDES